MTRPGLRLLLLGGAAVLVLLLVLAMTTEDADQNALLRGISQLLRALGALARLL